MRITIEFTTKDEEKAVKKISKKYINQLIGITPMIDALIVDGSKEILDKLKTDLEKLGKKMRGITIMERRIKMGILDKIDEVLNEKAADKALSFEAFEKMVLSKINSAKDVATLTSMNWDLKPWKEGLQKIYKALEKRTLKMADGGKGRG